MIGPLPYLTFWQVAEKWSEESKKSLMEVIQIMRVHATYKYPSTNARPCPVPSLLVWPTACFSAKGEIDEITIFNANRMIEKDVAPSIEDIKRGKSKYRTKYRTPEYIAAESFFNSSESPPEPTEEVKKYLSLFAIRREDFRNWCFVEGEPLPKFWFPLDEVAKITCPIEPAKKSSNLPDRKGKIVPENERRNVEDFTRVIDSLFNQLQKEGNTEVLKPRQLEAYLKCLKKRVNEDSKMKDGITTYSQLVKNVKVGNPDECILMEKPRVVRGKKDREIKWYTLNDVSRHLSELRRVFRDQFPHNP
jgi:hypothetical protein